MYIADSSSATEHPENISLYSDNMEYYVQCVLCCERFSRWHSLKCAVWCSPSLLPSSPSPCLYLTAFYHPLKIVLGIMAFPISTSAVVYEDRAVFSLKSWTSRQDLLKSYARCGQGSLSSDWLPPCPLYASLICEWLQEPVAAAWHQLPLFSLPHSHVHTTSIHPSLPYSSYPFSVFFSPLPPWVTQSEKDKGQDDPEMRTWVLGSLISLLWYSIRSFMRAEMRVTSSHTFACPLHVHLCDFLYRVTLRLH